MNTRTIVFTIDVANRRRGEVATVDAGSADTLIAAGYATVHTEPAADEATPNRRRSRTVTSGVGGDPHPEDPNTGTS